MDKDFSESIIGGDKSFSLPQELKPFEVAIKPTVSAGEATGDFLSDLIDDIVDLFCDEE